MKGSSKYNLLAKNEPKKEKKQQEWVELQQVSNWHGKASNNDASYMKFQEEESEIGHGNVHFNKVNQKPTNPSIQQSKNVHPSLNMEKRMDYLQKESQSNQSNLVPNQQNVSKVQVTTQKVSNQQQYPSIKPQQIPSQSYRTFPNQNPYNCYNSHSTHRLPYDKNYPTNRSTTQQHQPSSQQHQSQIRQSTMSSSNIASSIRPSTRKGIPQMTVNCDKCTFTQSVPGNTQLYICCICNQINECYPLYGVFTCGVCRANVIYPHGTSRLIKCTKCLTVNKVNPEPSNKLEEVVTLGKEVIVLQEQNAQRVQYSQEKPRMNKNEIQKFTITEKASSSKPSDQPFKILPSQKTHARQFDFFDENNMPEITQSNQLRRQLAQTNEFKQKLIDFQQFISQKKEQRQDKQLFELSERLDADLRVKEQIKNQKQSQQRENQKQKQHQAPIQYPTIFDD